MKNPYIDFGRQLKTSLDYIIANLPVSPTFEDLNQQLVSSIYIINPGENNPVDLVVPLLKTVLPNVYNGYVSGGSEVRGPMSDVIQQPSSNLGPRTSDLGHPTTLRKQHTILY